jgi:hypothetical protein
MSRRSNIRKRIRQKKRNRSSRELAASTNSATNLELPRLNRVSTADLFNQIQREPQTTVFRGVLAEAIAADQY